MSVGAIIQARRSSTRLPDKVIKELPYGSGITNLSQVIRRVKYSKRVNDVIVATTTDPKDQLIVDIAKKEQVKWFCGSEDNVLERYFLSAKKNNLETVVRITSDCPCVDPDIVDLIIEQHCTQGGDYTSNTLIKSYPHGLDVEVFSFKALEEACNSAEKNEEKEHVTVYIYQNPSKFKINKIEAPQQHFGPDIRITLDTEEDYALLCMVFLFLNNEDRIFKIEDIISLFNEKPWLKIINRKVVHKGLLETDEEELAEALKIIDLQGLSKAKTIIEKSLENLKITSKE